MMVGLTIDGVDIRMNDFTHLCKVNNSWVGYKFVNGKVFLYLGKGNRLPRKEKKSLKQILK